MTITDLLTDLEAKAKQATPGEWFWNSYSAIFSAIYSKRWDDAPDYPSEKRPGPPWFTPEDNAWLKRQHDAYEAESIVASVPAEYGDTATGRHAGDADYIAACSPERILALVAWAKGLASAARWVVYEAHADADPEGFDDEIRIVETRFVEALRCALAAHLDAEEEKV